MILRKTPPIEFLQQFFEAFQLPPVSLEHTPSFTKEQIKVSQVELLLPELESYYIPCKAQIYLHPPLTSSRCITIAKHILRANGYSLLSTELSIKGVKHTQYTIQSNTQPTSSLDVSFT
jgi:hypothetical protein